MNIRLARALDAAGIAQMSRSYIEQGLGWSWTETRVQRAIRDKATNVVVACEGTSLLGFGIMLLGDEAAHLALLAVDPAHRNQGLGSQLLAWLEKPVAVAGISLIRLEARADNPAGLAFYERLGFKELARVPGYYQGMVDAVRMHKKLGDGSTAA